MTDHDAPSPSQAESETCTFPACNLAGLHCFAICHHTSIKPHSPPVNAAEMRAAIEEMADLCLMAGDSRVSAELLGLHLRQHSLPIFERAADFKFSSLSREVRGGSAFCSQCMGEGYVIKDDYRDGPYKINCPTCALSREEREIERFNQLGRDLNAVNPRHHLDDLILNPQSEDNAVPPQSLGDAT